MTTVDELRTLNDAEIVRGYGDGRRNEADFSATDKGYWHGFLNGLVDGTHAQPSPAQMQLVQAMLDSGEFRKLFGG